MTSRSTADAVFHLDGHTALHAPNGRNLVRLENAQQLDLRFQIQLTDLVKRRSF